MRLYISTENPSNEFIEIIEYIVKVYIPVWFSIKQKHSIAHGSINLFQLIESARKVSDRCQSIIKEVIKRNGYFAHHENVLIALVNDDNESLRKLGWRMAKKARELMKGNKNIRAFSIPKINFSAENYYNIVDWDVFYTEPPLTKIMSDEDIDAHIENGNFPKHPYMSLACCSISNIPCHSQAVERMVKLVSESAKNVVGDSNRDGFIRSTIKSRRNNPYFETKADYNLY